MPKIFDQLSHDDTVRCILFSGNGDKAFSAGLDVQASSTSGPVANADSNDDVARRAWKIRRHMYEYQNTVTSIERCEKRMYRQTRDILEFEILCRG